MIFGVSGVLSLEQGLNSLLLLGEKGHHPDHHIENVNVSYIILAISTVFEGNALRVALVLSKRAIELRGDKFGIGTLIKEFQESKDPSILTVLVEDSAHCLVLVLLVLVSFSS